MRKKRTFYVFRLKDSRVLLTTQPQRKASEKYAIAEMVGSCKSLEAARLLVKKQFPRIDESRLVNLAAEYAKVFSTYYPDSQKHLNIPKTNRYSVPRFYAHHHNLRWPDYVKRRMSEGMARSWRIKKLWCVDPEGNEYRVPVGTELPKYWAWGRNKDVWKKA